MECPDPDLITYLEEFVSENKRSAIDEALAHRTRYVTVVLEDIYQSHNASAVLRSCESFGIQDVHIIENRNTYTLNPGVSLGAAKWVNLIRHNSHQDNTEACLNTLKASGYRLVASSPHKAGDSPETLDLFNGPVAILMGTEMQGLSSKALEMADSYVRIPMSGFTESLNISVSAAIILYRLVQRMRADASIPWKLTTEEQETIRLAWYTQVVRNSDLHIARYNKSKNL